MSAVADQAAHIDEAENLSLLAQLSEVSPTWTFRPETEEMGVLYVRPVEQYWFVNGAALTLFAAMKEGGDVEGIVRKFHTAQLRAFASRLQPGRDEVEPTPAHIDSGTPWIWSTDEQVAPERCSTFGMPL